MLNDSLCGRLLDQYYVPNREKGKSAESVLETVNGVLAVIGQKYNVDLVENQEKIVESVKSQNSTLLIIKMIFVCLIIILYIWAQVYGSYGGSSYHGGYRSGGFSSGGGHFGGGHSGGGGASR